MKKMKKALAVILSLAMVLGMSLTAFAETGKAPTKDDKTTATVSNVETGAIVTAYRVVEPVYGTNGGFKEYKSVEGTNINNPVAPTSTEVTAIAANKTLLADLTSVKLNEGTVAENGLATYTAELTPGYWVVIVTGSAVQEIYNPMLVGVYYSVSGSDGQLTSQPVDANTNWTLEVENAFAKSTPQDMKKTIVSSIAGETGNDNTDENMNGKGNDVAIGDTVNYKIATTIPSYSDSYANTNVRVEISDTLSKGLDLTADSIVVKVNGAEVEKSEKTYKLTTAGKTFLIEFVSEYSLAHDGEAVEVTYSAVLNEDAETNFDPNTNKATFTYTNDPQNRDSVKQIDKETYTYTFEIDGSLSGKYEEIWNKVTEELLKGKKKVETTEEDRRENFVPVKNAEFSLTNNVTGKVYTAKSDADGKLNFVGLDAGNYTLRETKAPDGFSINDAEIPVEITASYNDNGTLESYSIKVNNQNTSTYTATYDGKTITHVEYDKTGTDPDEEISDSYYFWNTELANLPSTGGIGTTIFTIGGCAIMIIAAALFFASRRKAVK